MSEKPNNGNVVSVIAVGPVVALVLYAIITNSGGIFSHAAVRSIIETNEWLEGAAISLASIPVR
jgi:hypothetical protein